LSTVPDSITGDISENSLSCIQHQYTWVTNLSLPGFELNRTVLTVYLPKRLHQQLKAAAIQEDREMSAIVEELIDTWLKSREN
jgi:hypothetical protein